MKTLIFLILLLSINATAQFRFQIKDAPAPYDVTAEVSECDDNECSGDLNVWLKKKGQSAIFQHFKLKSDFQYSESYAMLPAPYERQGAIHFGDYNFDGIADLAIQNGRDGGYGGSSYNIYVYSPRTKKFVFNREFSDLATGPYSGMFTTNTEKKTIEVFSKSGCCFHEEREYKVVKGRPVMIYQQVEDAFSSDTYVITMTNRFENGRWNSMMSGKKKDEAN